MSTCKKCDDATDQITDPVCGMKVSSDSKLYYQYEDQTFHFCSDHCLHKFEDNPETYLNSSDSVSLTDPVCGMSVTEDSEFNYDHKNITYRFCSEHCLDKFKQKPEACLEKLKSPADISAMDKNVMYTCPMDPEIEQLGPGTCPKCGMALEPMGVPVLATKTEYTCPMHPEVVQDHPGTCPKCGMALEPMTVTVEEKNEELDDMNRRFWISSIFAIPVFILAMIADMVPQWLPEALSMRSVQWIEFVLATPVVLWGGVALLYPRLAICQNMEFEHVYLNWFRCLGGVGLQCGGIITTSCIPSCYAT